MELVRQPLKDFCAENGFVSISKTVGISREGYPFVTFKNAENESTSIWFSKSASADLQAGQPVDKAFLAKYQIGHTVNADGEARTKLVRIKMETIDLSDLFD